MQIVKDTDTDTLVFQPMLKQALVTIILLQDLKVNKEGMEKQLLQKK